MNLLIEGDNIKGLNYLLHTRDLQEKIDLVYIDPPFATGSDFTITKERAATVSHSRSGSIAYSDRLVGAEFIEFLRERLILLRELLSAQGSIAVLNDLRGFLIFSILLLRFRMVVLFSGVFLWFRIRRYRRLSRAIPTLGN